MKKSGLCGRKELGFLLRDMDLLGGKAIGLSESVGGRNPTDGKRRRYYRAGRTSRHAEALEGYAQGDGPPTLP